MGGEAGRGDSLPLLPAGFTLFENLPARAIVLDALAPAIGEGIITLVDGERKGVLVIRGGCISDARSIDGGRADGARADGEAARQLMAGWDDALMSASRLAGQAMSLVGPLIRGEPCYEDLRLEWTVWPELLNDLRTRGRTYVIEARTATGRGVTIVRSGQQVATYTDAHPSLGDPDLLDALAAGGPGVVRVTVEPETSAGLPTGVASGATTTEEAGSGEGAPRERGSAHAESRTGLSPEGVTSPEMAAADAFYGNETLTALFGARAGMQPLAPLVVLNRSPAPARSEVGSFLPQLKLLVQQRLQRSAGPVEDVVDAAADGGESVDWLADRVRVMRVRGFMKSTFEQLADEMLALTRE